MLRTRMLAGLSMLALGTTISPSHAGDQPDAPKPPAQSIREWMAPPAPPAPVAPAANPAVAPTGRTLAGATLATPAAAPGSAPAPARSIREWQTTASPALGPCSTATPLAAVPATPAASTTAKPAATAAGPTTPITISIKSTLRQGNLVVLLDGAPIFNEPFQKPLLFISQTTTWDPIQVAAGTHRLTAKVYGAKKTYLSKTYDLQISRTKGAALHFVMQGEALTVAL
ncbi:MAG TPA: hypothetical protein VFV19_08125 [Candidatus Polarisedimenticolaceae bacterium]|nr:hypothetical protein [Candidatus Polarisedimenticolaceae bacterium]